MRILSISLFFLFLFTLQVTAQNILIVDNTELEPSGDNYYTSLQTAIDEAQNGDIIHVIPSPNIHGQINIVAKSNLTIIGAGYNAGAGSNLNPNDSRIIDIDIRNSNGVVLKGLYVAGPNGINIGDTQDSGSINTFISESVIRNLDLDRADGVTVSNCFIYDALTTSSSLSTNVSISNSVIRVVNFQQVNNSNLENNLITGSNLFGSVNNNIFSGNIIAGNSTGFEGPIWGNKNNTFNNNFSTTLISWEDGSNTGSNNIYSDITLEAIFVDDSVRSDMDWSLDWLLEADGAQFTGKGPTEGVTPMDGSPIFSLPFIYEVIAPSTLKAGEETEVTIKARVN